MQATWAIAASAPWHAASTLVWGRRGSKLLGEMEPRVGCTLHYMRLLRVHIAAQCTRFSPAFPNFPKMHTPE